MYQPFQRQSSKCPINHSCLQNCRIPGAWEGLTQAMQPLWILFTSLFFLLWRDYISAVKEVFWHPSLHPDGSFVRLSLGDLYFCHCYRLFSVVLIKLQHLSKSMMMWTHLCGPELKWTVCVFVTSSAQSSPVTWVFAASTPPLVSAVARVLRDTPDHRSRASASPTPPPTSRSALITCTYITTASFLLCVHCLVLLWAEDLPVDMNHSS